MFESTLPIKLKDLPQQLELVKLPKNYRNIRLANDPTHKNLKTFDCSIF